jgi:hypothetical protein
LRSTQEKSETPLSINNLGMVEVTYNARYVVGIDRNIVVQIGLKKSKRPYLKS